MRNFIFTMYLIFKASMVLGYLWVLVAMFQYYLAPLIAMYGFWPFIGTLAMYSALSFIFSFLFFITPLPKKPQATFKSPSVWSTPKEYQDYLDSIKDITYCYQCDKPTTYLFPDSRCKDCTSITPDELQGNIS